jgi:hypothetical protein
MAAAQAVEPGIRISPHEPSINDALILLDFAGTGPRDVVLIGIVPERLDGGGRLPCRSCGAPASAELDLGWASRFARIVT